MEASKQLILKEQIEFLAYVYEKEYISSSPFSFLKIPAKAIQSSSELPQNAEKPILQNLSEGQE